VADFVGSANIIEGRVSATSAAGGPIEFATASGHVLHATAPHATHGQEVAVAVRTAYIETGGASSANQIAGTVRRRMFHGDFVQYIVDCPLGQLIVRRPPTNLLAEGDVVDLSFSPEHCILLEA
jgi:ABC-type Fe3+/spermidine/putrescine transport system ATPase subunit